MRVAIPHSLDKETVRQRLRDNSHKIADQVPGGMADVHSSWRDEDTLDLTIGVMGQELRGDIAIEDGQVVFTMALPPALGFLEPIVEGAIKQGGQKMLAPPKS
ncbi:polyhydroxyalkanoic acid system family protein [Tsuneonella sp. HG222]